MVAQPPASLEHGRPDAHPGSRAGGALRTSDQDRARAAEYVARYGREGMACLILKEGMSYWFGSDGCVAYYDTGSAWVAAGSPLGPDGRASSIAERFAQSARDAKRRPVFFGTEAMPDAELSMRAVCIGEQPTWDPGDWPSVLSSSRSLREQLRRARAKGVTVTPLSSSGVMRSSSPMHHELRGLFEEWLGAKGLAPMGFLVSPEPFALPGARRYFVARLDGNAVACLIAVPVPTRRGWLVETVLRASSAPNGTTETLLDAFMRQVAREGSGWVTLGLAPLSGATPGWMKRVGTWTPWLFDFEGLRRFKARLRPSQWEPMYVWHPRGMPSWWALWEISRAFARGSVWRFGLRTALRHPVEVAGALAVGVACTSILMAVFG